MLLFVGEGSLTADAQLCRDTMPSGNINWADDAATGGLGRTVLHRPCSIRDARLTIPSSASYPCPPVHPILCESDALLWC